MHLKENTWEAMIDTPENQLNGGGCLVWCATIDNHFRSWKKFYSTGTYCGDGQNKAYCFKGKCIDAFELPERLENKDIRLIYPELTNKYDHFDRKLNNQDKLRYVINAFNQTFVLDVKKNRDLLSDDVLMETINEDGSTTKHDGKHVKDCIYEGKVLFDDKSIAFVSVCGGLLGFMYTYENKYIIEPLPEYLSRHDLKRENAIPHIIYKVSEIPEISSHVDDFINSNPEWNNNISSTRYKRRNLDEISLLTIEMAVFADYYMFNKYKRWYRENTTAMLTQYLMALVQGAQMVLNLPSLGQIPIKIVIVNLKIYTTDDHPWTITDVGWIMYRSFTKYLPSINDDDDSNPNHFDYALLITGINIKSPSGNEFLDGISAVSGMCHPTDSSSLTEGRNFDFIYVLAHEIGHGFGIAHDGPDNGCSISDYIMGEAHPSKYLIWSECSKFYMDGFLKNIDIECLLDKRDPISSWNHEVELPGQKFSLEEQCQMVMGIHAIPYPTLKLPNICQHIKCSVGYIGKSKNPAIEGTFCGPGKWCRNQSCVSWGDLDPPVIDGTWGLWSPMSDCQSGCSENGMGINSSVRLCNNPSPKNGGKYCEGDKYKFRLCSDDTTCPSKISLHAAARRVCENKPLYAKKEFTHYGKQSLKDKSGGCLIWCETIDGNFSSWNKFFPTGTYCGDGQNRAYCFEGKCIEFLCSSSDECIGGYGPLYY